MEQFVNERQLWVGVILAVKCHHEVLLLALYLYQKGFSWEL